MRPRPRITRLAERFTRVRRWHALRLVAALTAAMLAVRGAAPASAHAADLFPVDDWIGDGLKKAGDVVLGPLKLSAEQLARLIATIVGAIADLLVPKSLVHAGLDGIRWLVQLPPVGAAAAGAGGPMGEVRMPHLLELRQTLTWIGVTVLPLGLVLAAGRAFLAPGLDDDSPSEILQRVIVAGLGLVVYDWAWGVVVRLVRLVTDAILGLPWVKDGVERMLETLVIGGATGSAVAAEFVVPLLMMLAGGALLGLLLIHVGLEVAAALVYVFGGLALGLSVTSFGRRVLTAWMIAASAIVLLPIVWSVVFATGAALMLDAGSSGGRGGFASFVAQLYNVAAALAVFWIAIKLALGLFRHASGAITGIAFTPATSSRPAGAAGRAQRFGQNATPAGLARFSERLRGGLRGVVVAGARAGSFPVRHPVAAAGAIGHPVRSTQQAAGRLREALAGGGLGGAAVADAAGARVSRPARNAGAGADSRWRSGEGKATSKQGSQRSSGARTSDAAMGTPPRMATRRDSRQRPVDGASAADRSSDPSARVDSSAFTWGSAGGPRPRWWRRAQEKKSNRGRQGRS